MDAMNGHFTPPHEDTISTSALADDCAHLAELTRANPEVQYHVRYRETGSAHHGVLEGETIHRLVGDPFDGAQRTGETTSLDEVRLLAPVDPNRVSKVVGVAANTLGPDLEEVPPRSHPIWFTKLPTSITGPGGGIEVPEEASRLLHEGELVLVIGRRGRHISVEAAPDHIFGVTAGNDVTEFSWFGEEEGRGAPSRTVAKGTDTFAPLGPAIAVGLDYSDLEIVHRLNGEVTQRGSCGDRLQGPAELVSHLSRFTTLLPGDVVFTGAAPFEPDARREIRPGDELEAEIEGIGILRNRAVPMEGVRWDIMVSSPTAG